MLFRRKSFHLFRNLPDLPLDEEALTDIVTLWRNLIPLYDDIRTNILIVPAEESTCRRGNEYTILFFSEKKEGYLRNIGYLGMQLDLHLAQENIGTLWYGIGKEERSLRGLSFVIMMGIRRVPAESFRKDMFKSRRRPLEEIWQGEVIPGVSEIVRFAPSACNTQPWKVIRQEDILEVYRLRREGKRGIMPKDRVVYYNRIDIGIFLCTLEILLEEQNIDRKRELFADQDDAGTEVLSAIYRLEGKRVNSD